MDIIFLIVTFSRFFCAGKRGGKQKKKFNEKPCMSCIHSFFKSAGSPTFLYGLLSGDNIIVIIMKVACSVICVVYSVYKMVWLFMFIATEESENNRKDCVKVSNRFFVMMIFLLVCLSCPCCCCVC